MQLPNSLVKDFAKITNDTKDKNTDTFVYGTARNVNGQVYVMFDGSELYTPVLSTIDVNDNDRVLVMIQNHTGTVTSNVSSPAVGSTNFNNFKTNTEGAIETLSGQYDYITANYASFDYLAANYATFGYLEAQYAKIETLESDYAKISTLESDYIKTTEIEAQYAKIATVDANYAHIDLANIEAGSIQTYMLGEGVVGTAQIADGSITDAKIVGLTANKITAGTLNAGVIDVVNLNADNITTGSINGNRIKDGAINYDKLAETVSNDISDAKDAASKAVISATDEYTLTDTTDSPTASNVWSTDTPTKAEGQYIWRRVVTRYGNGSITTGNPAMLTGNTGAVGEKGDQGAPGSDGVGIYSSKVSYRASSDGINVPDDSVLDSNSQTIYDSTNSKLEGDVWLDYIPELSEGEYLWTRTEIIYTDANKSVSYSVSRSGIDGVDGEDGKPGKDGLDISSVAKYYTLSSSMPTKPTTVPPESIWSENEPAYTSGSNSKLYSVELTVFSDNSFSYSTPCLSSSYEAAKDAYNKAQNAQTTANAKNAVIYQDYVPETTSDRKLYDVWFDTANGNLMYYWNGSAWTPRKFNTSALAEKCITADLVAANAITADNIVAGTITSAQLNTSEIFSNSAVITQIFAQNVTATGTITGGTFIGGSIKSSNYQAGTSPYSGAGMLVNLANGSIEAKKFGVTTSGVLYATEANITGYITATSLTAQNVYYLHDSAGTKKAVLASSDAEFRDNAPVVNIGTGFTYVNIKNNLFANGQLMVGANGGGSLWCGNFYGGDIECGAIITNVGIRTYGNVNRIPIGSESHDKNRVSLITSYTSSISIRAQWGVEGASYTARSLSVPSSDIRLKDNVQQSEVDALSVINQIQMRQFDWKDRQEHWDVGFVADELEKIDPLLSIGGGTDEDGNPMYKSVNDFYLLGYLTKAVQELSAENARLKKRVSHLEAA